MRSPALVLASLLTLPLAACVGSYDDTGDDAAEVGIIATLEPMPDVTIDDEFGTDVRVFVDMHHHGGPTAETFEVVSASLNLDHEHYADIELAIPDDNTQFSTLASGEDFMFQLRGRIDDTHDDWGLCLDVDTEDADELRVSLSVVLRVTPGANDDADEFEFESQAVTLHCSHTG